nr:kinase suppressor of Ras 1-like [Ovis aries]
MSWNTGGKKGHSPGLLTPRPSAPRPGGGLGGGKSPAPRPAAPSIHSAEEPEAGKSEAENDEDEVDNLPTSRRPWWGPISRKASQTSVYLQEWDIPFEQVELGEPIGQGRWGPVHRGRWHGEVAIRLLEMDGHNQDHLKLFKKELLQGTDVAFVCEGPQDISGHQQDQADHPGDHLGKGSKTPSCPPICLLGPRLGIPVTPQRTLAVGAYPTEVEWLYQDLCPEPAVSQTSHHTGSSGPQVDSGWSQKSGRTVWYELQARDWPLKNQAAEALIWQIGSGEGMKRVLASVSLGKEVTEILSACWAFDLQERPSFPLLMDMLEKLPKLNRRLSHPGHFWKSADINSSKVVPRFERFGLGILESSNPKM